MVTAKGGQGQRQGRGADNGQPTIDPSSTPATTPIVGPVPGHGSPGAVLAAAQESAAQSAAFRAFTAQLIQRFQLAEKLGFDSFGEVRNLFTALGLPTELTINHHRTRYKRGGIAKTLVELLPSEMWGRGVEIVESENPRTSTKFEQDVLSLFERLSVVPRLMKADILASLGKYSVILIGAKRPKDSIETLETPLPLRLAGPDSIAYLMQYAEDNAKVDRLVDDPTDERFGQPEFYSLNTGTVQAGKASKKTHRVHWTRIIHIAHDTLESEYLGEPVLSWGWNDLEALYKVVWGGAEAAWRRMDPGNHIKFDPQFEFDDEAKAGIRDQLELYRHSMLRDVGTQGVDIEPLNAQVNNYGSNADTILDLISGTYRIPKRRLLGSERGELASSQDRANLNDTISQRSTRVGNLILRQLIDRFVLHGILAKPTSGKYQIEWGEEEELSEMEKATLGETMARTNQLQNQADGTVVYLRDEIRDSSFKLDPLPEEVEDEEEEEKETEKEVIEELELEPEPDPESPPVDADT